MPPERARRDIREVRGGRVFWRRAGGTFLEGRIQAGCRRWRGFAYPFYRGRVDDVVEAVVPFRGGPSDRRDLYRGDGGIRRNPSEIVSSVEGLAGGRDA